MHTVQDGRAAREVDWPEPDEGRLEHAIGAQLRGIRGESGQTLAAMAERTGISCAALSKIENA